MLQLGAGEFNDLAGNPQLDLYPADLAAAIDEVGCWLPGRLGQV